MSKEKKNRVVPELRFPEFIRRDEWKEKTFGETAKFINGRAYKQEELLTEGKYRVLRVGNFFTNNEWYYSDLELEDDKYCENDDLLYAWSASFGPRIWTEEKVIYHYHIWKVVNNPDVNKGFLYLLLDYETERMKTQSANGFALLHITKGTIENWKCYIPKSETEQQKIASCLSSLDDLITAHTQKLDALKAHKKGLMQQLFPAEGEKVPKLRFKEFEGSGEWEEKKLSSICTNIASGKDKVDENGEFDLYGSTGVIGKTDCGSYEGNFILVARVGANAGFLNRVNGKFGVTDNTLVIFLDESENMDFVYHTLDKTGLNKLVFGSGQPLITGGQLKDLVNYFPNPKEQQKIASCLSSLDELIRVQAQKIEQLKMHKKGLMQGLFPSALSS